MKYLLDRFLHSQTTGAIVLLVAAASALFWANSTWSGSYFAINQQQIGFYIGDDAYLLTFGDWIKDGLMVIFFFVVGLEIKREVLVGELSDPRKALLPIAAACGGAVVPAIFYAIFNLSGGEAARGWGIPMATDIAFALGVLALFGTRVPLGLKVFLTALAIVDDLLAILVIAFFYTSNINFTVLIIAALLLALLSWVVRRRMHSPGIHLPILIGIWLCILLSGIHATIAGVLIAMIYPVQSSIKPEVFFDTIKTRINQLEESRLTRNSMIDDKKQLRAMNQIYLTTQDMIPSGIAMEENLHSIQAYLILPLFALSSAGVVVDNSVVSSLPDPVSMGVFSGLVFGKPIGIMLTSAVLVRSGMAKLGKGITWPMLFGCSVLAGIGFTMSIFIAELAFTDPQLISEAKLSIFAASISAAVLGSIILNWVLPEKKPEC
ncbi:MAG: Na+/H+ antiporter NhaA [Desulfobulbaceae bacterium]|nr:Na+/H+ antiporter NhaA [Desulfobulbaceae bacterium]